MPMNKQNFVAINFDEGDFVPAPGFGPLTMSIMPVIYVKDEMAKPIGTCFAISNDGLCLTARHVIEEALPGPLNYGVQVTEDDGWLYVLYASDQPNEDNPEHTLGGLIPVQKVYSVRDIDIAAIQLQLPRHAKTNEYLPMPANKMGLGLPALQDTCCAFGYHAMNWEKIGDIAKVTQQFSSSRGVVEEIHLARRDAVVAPFPCFRTSARYDAGMSGGPVIGTNGSVIGVICSSYERLSSADGYISYVSLVAPAVLIPVERKGENGKVKKYFIGDLIERGIVLADMTGVTLQRCKSELRLHIGGGEIRNSIDD
jgi:hypothetical protein